MSAYLFNKEYAQEADISSLQFDLPVHNQIKSYIIAQTKENKKIRFNDLYESISEEYAQELSTIAGMETYENKTLDKAAYFYDCVRTLRFNKLNKEIDRLTKLFNEETDNEKRREYATEMSKLMKEKNKLS